MATKKQPSKKSTASKSARTSAESPKKKRQLRAAPPTTVREKATTAAQKSAKPRKAQQARSVIWTPFRVLFRIIGRILRPFSFLLIPFRTRPARAIGRFLASVLLLTYIRNSWKELRQVTWPTARMTAKLTLAVVLFAIFFGLFVALVDYLMGLGVEKLIMN